MPQPHQAWEPEDGIPRGCAIAIEGTPDKAVHGCRVNGARFSNFPSGPLFAFHADDLDVSNCIAVDCQRFSNAETNGIFSVFFSQRVSMSRNIIRNFNWKGFYFRGCEDSVGHECYAYNGHPFQASHYVKLGANCGFRGGGTVGGFGFKAFDTARPFAENMKFRRVTCGLFFDASPGFHCVGNVVSEVRNQGIIVGSEAGFRPTRGGRIAHCNVDYAEPGKGINQSGIQLVAVAPDAPLTDITIESNEVTGAFWGIGSITGAGRLYRNIYIRGNALHDCVQYGAVIPLVSGEFSRNYVAVRKETGQAGCEFWVPVGIRGGGILQIDGNDFSSTTVTAIKIGDTEEQFQCRYTALHVKNNIFDNAKQSVVIIEAGAAHDAIDAIDLSGNVGVRMLHEVSVRIRLNKNRKTNVSIIGNVFTGEMLEPRAIRISNFESLAGIAGRETNTAVLLLE